MLLLITCLALVLTLFLPWSPFATDLGLAPVPANQILSLFGILVAYMFTADWLKILFFKFHKV